MKKFIFALLPLTMFIIFTWVMIAGAATYTFTPNYYGRSDLNDLDHYKLYVWAIDPSAMLSSMANKSERITSATIHVTNVWNWANESNDILKFYLVDNPKWVDRSTNDVWVGTDNQYTSGSLKELTDPSYINPYSSSYRFSSILKLWQWTDERDLRHNPNPYTGAANSYGHDLSYTFDQADMEAPNGTTNELDALVSYLASPNPKSSSTYPYATFGLGFDPDCHYYNDGITLTIETAPVPEPGTILFLGAGAGVLALISRRRKM